MNVLKQLYDIPISKKVIPMVEVIQERVKSNSNKDFIEELSVIFNRKKTSNPFLVDIVKTNIPNNIMPAVRDFLTKVNRKRGFYIDILKRLKTIKNAIPVVSYNPNSLDIEDLIDDTANLRDDFEKLAFRLTSTTFSAVFEDIKELIDESDYLILDIDSASHINPALKRMYLDILKAKKQIGFTSIILNSTKAKEVTNIGLEDGEPIFAIDNSLKDAYKKPHGFDGFGDYACVVNELPSSGGTISPAGIYYSYDYNYFVGYRKSRDLADFENHIAPAIVASEYWDEYSDDHHEKCPGCRTIYGITEGQEAGKSQAKWKGITMAHYIYTMSEKL